MAYIVVNDQNGNARIKPPQCGLNAHSIGPPTSQAPPDLLTHLRHPGRPGVREGGLHSDAGHRLRRQVDGRA